MTSRMLITGDKKLDKALVAMGAATPAIGAAGLRAGVGVISKSIKKQFPTKYRKNIGHKVKKKGRLYVAKAGAGVGKKRKPAVERGARPGVGISANNIHWLVMGTGFRFTKNGRATGRMPAAYADAVRAGTMQAMSAAKKAIADKIAERMKNRAEKMAKGRSR